MADEPNRTKRNNMLLAFLLGAAVVALGVVCAGAAIIVGGAA